MATTKYLYNLPKHSTSDGRPRLLRVITSNEYTRIDLGYQATNYYERGGWVTIAPGTFLRMKNNKENFVMTHAENIPVEPAKHHFESIVGNLFFTLYFPPLPAHTLSFDLIEEEPLTPTLFNYYNIRLENKLAVPLMDGV